MARKARYASPTLQLKITPDLYERAVQASSGGCLIADAIKEQYPQFHRVVVDMATIRFSDTKAGKRYTYLTTPAAQHLLLAFDQGWPQASEEISLRRAVRVTTITNSPKEEKTLAERRAARKAELEEKVAAGEELTQAEKSSLTRFRNPKPKPKRPSARGGATVSSTGVVAGGPAPVLGESHPNLLRGRNRLFGAKSAKPSEAFQEAVDAAVAERLGQQELAPAN